MSLKGVFKTEGKDMISALLAILKFPGILLLFCMGLILVILLLVLFVPVRYI